MQKWAVYVQEARTQIRFACFAYEQYLKARELNDVEGIFRNLHHFMVHLAAVARLLDLNAKTHKTRRAQLLERARLLEGKIDLESINFELARKMRNHLEHYDERLDRWISNHYGSALFDMNLVTGATGFPFDLALRALDGDTLRFMGESYNLPEMFRTISHLDERLAAI